MSPLIRTAEAVATLVHHLTTRPAVAPYQTPSPTFAEAAASLRHGGWHARTVYSLSEAGDLCDWLDAHGVRERAFRVLGNTTFEVGWR